MSMPCRVWSPLTYVPTTLPLPGQRQVTPPALSWAAPSAGTDSPAAMDAGAGFTGAADGTVGAGTSLTSAAAAADSAGGSVTATDAGNFGGDGALSTCG